MSNKQLLVAMRAIVADDRAVFAHLLTAEPALALEVLETGASRQQTAPYFFDSIRHYVYAGDTALHVAAAALRPALAKLLLKAGASVNVKNRRGAEPLHYAVDGGPGNPAWDPEAQVATIEALLAAGADRTRANKSGSRPLQLAKLTTGRGGTGSAEAKAQQAEIVRLLSARSS